MPFLKRFCRALIFRFFLSLAFAWMAASGPASAQNSVASTPLLRMVDVYAAVELDRIELLTGADSAWKLDQILANPALNFKLIPADQTIQDASWESSLWLRLVLRPAEPQAGKAPSAQTLLEIPKPYLDDIALYTPSQSAAGGWHVQRAGDTVAITLWTLPGQFPRFALPTLEQVKSSSGERMVLYMRIPHRIPASFHVNVMTSTELMNDMQWGSLMLGIAFGSMLLAALVSIVFMLLHHDKIFVWYFFYAVAALMACLSHSGMAVHLLWPHGGVWPSSSLLTFMLIAAASQLQFSKLLFMETSSAQWPVRCSEWLGCLTLAVALIFPWVSLGYWISVLFLSQALVLACMLLTLSMVVASWRQGNRLAMALLLTFVPLFATVIVGLMDAQGILSLIEVGYNAPIYAASFEVSLLALCLQWFARERHGQRERARALASTDPLTGFSDAASFQVALQKEWSAARLSGHLVYVAYIQLLNKNPTAQMLKRSVRILRTVSGEGDVVARLDERTLALLMPNLIEGSDMSSRLSRIVALSLIPDRTDQRNPTLRLRVGATSSQHYTKSADQLQIDLRHFMADDERWNKKSIRYLMIDAQSIRHRLVTADALDELWAQALEAEKAAVARSP